MPLVLIIVRNPSFSSILNISNHYNTVYTGNERRNPIFRLKNAGISHIEGAFAAVFSIRPRLGALQDDRMLFATDCPPFMDEHEVWLYALGLMCFDVSRAIVTFPYG
ncbi:hypothetical protein [Paenibacillus radicis (ex Gao et al. 2016)]|uniref:Uncharacterized protein n=1 Tax=Paenibacillus radicis (ex Gao et al. 2016) TaxID=1737354 RepID=A0A917H020_9BACL|nr:hypothetical protein [Paenibacillus radicis (ex Gao et al. 2016)]GGG63135.1 hypothetical protein GCM10010918_16270 [Paenibacillus radicis (ex Gao et al. 2016)]